MHRSRNEVDGQESRFAGFDFGSAHFDGLNIFMCDGSGHWTSYSIDPPTFAMLCSRNNTTPIDNKLMKW